MATHPNPKPPRRQSSQLSEHPYGSFDARGFTPEMIRLQWNLVVLFFTILVLVIVFFLSGLTVFCF